MALDKARAHRLRRLRMQLGWTYQHTATMIGCTERVIRGWEAAADQPLRLSNARNAPDWFMEALEEYAAYIRAAPKFPQLHSMRNAA